MDTSSKSVLTLLLECKDRLPHLIEKVLFYLYMSELEALSKVSKDLKSIVSEIRTTRHKRISRTLQKILNDGLDEHGNKIEAYFETVQPLISQAASRGDVDMMRFLMQIGFIGSEKIDEEDRVGDRPLHVAAFHGKLEAVKVLLNEGQANLQLVNEFDGLNVLSMAAYNGNPELISYLISKGAQVNETVPRGNFPYYWSVIKYPVSREKSEQRGIFVRNGATDEGWTALHVAVANGKLEAVRVLAAKGGDVEQGTQTGFRPLHIAAKNGHLDIAKFLVENCNADLHAKTDKDDTAYQLATKHDHQEVKKYLSSCI